MARKQKAHAYIVSFYDHDNKPTEEPLEFVGSHIQLCKRLKHIVNNNEEILEAHVYDPKNTQEPLAIYDWRELSN